MKFPVDPPKPTLANPLIATARELVEIELHGSIRSLMWLYGHRRDEYGRKFGNKEIPGTVAKVRAAVAKLNDPALDAAPASVLAHWQFDHQVACDLVSVLPPGGLATRLIEVRAALRALSVYDPRYHRCKEVCDTFEREIIRRYIAKHAPEEGAKAA